MNRPKYRVAQGHAEGESRFLIAGGGTGGHLFPGIAVAEELNGRFEHTQILFVVGRKRMESSILSRYGYPVEFIDVEGIKGRGLQKGLATLFGLPRCFFQSLSIIKKFSPRLVVGMGAYSSGPVCLAAKMMRIPVAIHEQNSYPGLTTRMLSRFVDRIFISFGESGSFLRGKSIYLTGNPIRHELQLHKNRELKCEEKKTFTILVMGGSQGARAINEAFADALMHLNQQGKYPLVIHQTGKADYDRAEADYQSRGLKGELSPFILEMEAAYNQSDMVVSRAGATTIFELAALGKPSVLIPYPYATNQHQEINARSLVRSGGAEMILQKNLNGETLATMLAKYMDNKAELTKMGECASKTGRPDAAKVIVDKLEEIMK